MLNSGVIHHSLLRAEATHRLHSSCTATHCVNRRPDLRLAVNLIVIWALVPNSGVIHHSLLRAEATHRLHSSCAGTHCVNRRPDWHLKRL